MPEQQPDAPAPDKELRAARERLQQVSSILRKALADDERLAAAERGDER
jgi:hypothetical protein